MDPSLSDRPVKDTCTACSDARKEIDRLKADSRQHFIDNRDLLSRHEQFQEHMADASHDSVQRFRDLETKLQQAEREKEQYRDMAQTIEELEGDRATLQNHRDSLERLLRDTQKEMALIKHKSEERIRQSELQVGTEQSKAYMLREQTKRSLERYEKQIELLKMEVKHLDEKSNAEAEDLRAAKDRVRELQSENMRLLSNQAPNSNISQSPQDGQRWVPLQQYDAYMAWAKGQMQGQEAHIKSLVSVLCFTLLLQDTSITYVVEKLCLKSAIVDSGGMHFLATTIVSCVSRKHTLPTLQDISSFLNCTLRLTKCNLNAMDQNFA